jgi:hypothetical protein
MKKYGLILALSALSISTSNGISDLRLSSQLLKAIAHNNVQEVQVLLSTAKEQKVLNQQQKDAILEAACASVRYHKGHIKSFFNVPMDTAKIAKGLLLSALGVGGFILIRKLAPPTKIKVPSTSSGSTFDFDYSREKAREGSSPKAKSFSWKSRALQAAGLGCIGYGLWKMFEAPQLDDSANAQKIKQLVQKELFNIEPKVEVKPITEPVVN